MDVQYQLSYNTSYCYSASSNDHLENPFSDRFAFSSSGNNFSSPPRDRVLDSVIKERKPTTKKRSLKLSVDPQSVAARQRRQRIRKRFKILQTMVPGGSKMDTASMLDGAINYVKYLKSQIWLHQMFSNNFSGFNDLQVTSAATPNMP